MTVATMMKRFKGSKKSSEEIVIEPQDEIVKEKYVTWKDILILGVTIVVIGVIAGVLIFTLVNPVFPVGEILATVCM